MNKLQSALTLVSMGALFFVTVSGNAEQKGKPVFGRTDPSKFFDAPACHHGAGTIRYMELVGDKTMETNLLFIHRGVMPPGSGIGEHIHRTMEEMYVVFDSAAQFTVKGKTSELPAGSMALCAKGSSHGIYNASDREFNFINIGVAGVKGKYDNIDYNDDLTKTRVESPAPFLWANLDRTLLKPVPNAHYGKGTIMFRRLWSDDSFKTNWYFVDHCLLPPDTSIGYHQHNTIEEVYYIISGKGRMTVNNVTWDISAGDAIPCTLHDSHGIYNNTSGDLEILVVSVAKEKGVDRDGVEWKDDLTKQ